MRPVEFSGPLRAGLIEARTRDPGPIEPGTFSGPLRAGLIEARCTGGGWPAISAFSGPLRAGLIEAAGSRSSPTSGSGRFPAPCGPASLKRPAGRGRDRDRIEFSGPLRAGLIEAT